MLDDLAVLVEAEDVDTGELLVARPRLVAVEGHEVAVGQRSLELHPLAGILERHPLEVRDERLLSVLDVRVVLDVVVADVALDRLCRAGPVEHEVVERLGVLRVLLQAIVHYWSGGVAAFAGIRAGSALSPSRK